MVKAAHRHYSNWTSTFNGHYSTAKETSSRVPGEPREPTAAIQTVRTRWSRDITRRVPVVGRLNFPTFSGHAFIRTNLSLPAIRGSIDYALNWAATKAARIAETPISRCWALRANFPSAVEFLASLKVIRHASQPVSTLRSGPTANKLACIGVQKAPSKGGSNVF